VSVFSSHGVVPCIIWKGFVSCIILPAKMSVFATVTCRTASCQPTNHMSIYIYIYIYAQCTFSHLRSLHFDTKTLKSSILPSKPLRRRTFSALACFETAGHSRYPQNMKVERRRPPLSQGEPLLFVRVGVLLSHTATACTTRSGGGGEQLVKFSAQCRVARHTFR